MQTQPAQPSSGRIAHLIFRFDIFRLKKQLNFADSTGLGVSHRNRQIGNIS
ncbi:MAG: hypothetical protein LBK82_14335 [Planctomycetaceae bacterium]|jgi:hypothetical protein|nr:hypothetical protein [Planctomycetaceae bacterium]